MKKDNEEQIKEEEALEEALEEELEALEDAYRNKHEHEHRGRYEMLSGELTVSGSDQLVINLFRKDAPAEVDVRFKGHSHHVPCDHGQVDDIEWSVDVGAKGFYYITIIWSVNDSREVVWKACW